MRFAVAAVVCLVCGWYAHALWTTHRGSVPRVTVVVEPAPVASTPAVVRPASKVPPTARKPQTTPVPLAHNGNVCNYSNGVLDTCAGNGYVTPGIGYYPPPL